MANIYDSSFVNDKVMRPIGLVANWVNVKAGKYRLGRKMGFDGRHVEKERDTYSSYHLNH